MTVQMKSYSITLISSVHSNGEAPTKKSNCVAIFFN